MGRVSKFSDFFGRLRSLFHRQSLVNDLDTELRNHWEMLVEENLSRGMPRKQAEREASIRLGNPVWIKEAYRRQATIPLLESFLQDLHYAGRVLRRSPGFTLVAVLTLGLGIGLNTTVFTVYDSIARRLLPVKNPRTLVRLARWYSDSRRNVGFTQEEYAFVRDHTASFSGVAATVALAVPAAIDPKDSGEIVQARLVSGNYFPVLEVVPARGRGFLPGEDGGAGAPVAVLSHRFWERRFLADPQIVGKSIFLNGISYSIVGVTPASFTGTGIPPTVPDLWIPLSQQAQVAPQQDLQVQVLCRIRDGVSAKQVQSEMGVLLKQLESIATEHSSSKLLRLSAEAATFFDTNDGGFDVFLWVIWALGGAVSAVLLIGCVNLVNLLLARAVTRQREIAVRGALGASRGRILGQLCTESAVIGLMGGAVGFLFSVVICKGLEVAFEAKLAEIAPGAEFLFVRLSPSTSIFAYAVVFSMLTGVLVGLAPARQAMRVDVASAMKQEAAMAPGRRSRFRDLLIAGQIAACLPLLVAACWLGQGVLKASRVDPGFETKTVFFISLPPRALGNSPGQRDLKLAEVLQTLEAAPQIRAVSRALLSPMLGHNTNYFEPVGSRVTRWSPEARSLYNFVSHRYFETLGIPVLLGRVFTRQEVDRDAPVVVISEQSAQRYWPGEDPLGKQLKNAAGRSFTVIGVVKGVRNTNLSKVDPAYLYFPGSNATNARLLLVRVDGPEKATVALLHDVMNRIDRSLAMHMLVLNLETGPVELQRLMTETPAVVAAVLGGLGLLLSVLGIYGVVSYLVNQRTHEMGLRLALGADQKSVIALIFREALKPVFWGLPVGLAGAAAVAELLRALVVQEENPDLLFGVNPWNPVWFAGVFLFLVATVLLASWPPARRAARTDPAVTLRYE